MFWIPGLSLLVFFLILVPSIILGYKKGWRGALFVSIILLGFTMAWVGIGYLIYDKTLWPIYRDKILSKDLKVHSINLDLLKGSFELRIVLLFTGLLTPFSYLFVFLIWKLLSEKINKYMGPRTQETKDEYKKDMIYRKNATPSRLGGVAIMAGSTLFISSMAASAISTLSVPYKHRDRFTNFNDTLGRLYGLGQIGNPADAAAIQDFLKDINQTMVDGIQELSSVGTGINGQNKNENFFPNFQKIKNVFLSENGTALFLLMATDDLAAAKIFTMILDSNNNKATTDPLRLDSSTTKDSVDGLGNQIGFHDTTRNVFLADIKKQFTDNPLGFRLTPEVIKAIIEHYKKSFIGFDKSPFASNLIAAKSYLTNLQGGLSSKEQSLAQAKSRLAQVQAQLLTDANKLRSINGQTYTVTEKDAQTVFGYSLSETITYKHYAKDSMPTSPTNNPFVATDGSLLRNAINAETASKNDYQHYNDNEYTTAYNNLVSSRNTYNASRTTKEGYERTVNQKISNYNSINNELTNLRNELSYNQGELTTVNNHIHDLTVRISNIDKRLGELQGGLISTALQKLNDSKHTRDTLVSEKNTLDPQVLAAQSAMQQARTAWENETDPDLKNALFQTLQQKTKEYNDKKARLDNLNNTLIPNALNQINRAQIEYDGLTNEERTLTSQRASYDQEKNQYTTRKTSLESTIHYLIATRIPNKQTELATAKTAWDDAAGVLSRFIASDYTPKLNDYNSKQTTFNSTEATWNAKRADWDSKTSIVNDYKGQVNQLNADMITQNSQTDANVDIIAKLLRNTWSITNTNQVATEPSASDVEKASIKYAKWRIAYQNSIISNLQIIFNNKKSLYESNKAQLIEAYSAWLRRVG